MSSRILPAVLLLAMFASTPASAQTTDSGIDNELRDLNRSVSQLVKLVATLIDQNQDDLLLRRLEIKLSQTTPLETELRSLSNQIVELDPWLIQQEKDLERNRSALFEAESGVSTQEGVSAEQQAKMLAEQLEYQERELDQMIERIARMQQRAAELENLLSPLRAQLATLEQALDERQDR